MRTLSLVFTLALVPFVSFAQAQKPAPAFKISVEGQQCMQCHASSTSGLVAQWLGSAHAKEEVDCYSCHKAAEADPAKFDH